MFKLRLQTKFMVHCMQIDGVWHTSVVVDGVEYFYGGGVQQAMAGTTPYGQPVEIKYLGCAI